ncbi:hypothetical protein K461DRAFT_268970 [Myriangium duriaei CBS 260.36]|uniref:RING-type domain-containing protein n=1 Tax=Myriangium duriaei CBS 260.36 TaxID=1168546 RepID=A0A9P4IZN1_9PEZI|nr:hypothetical protein K461DRAFT_268970 [Myriangium duriaei CBS 260.36]
MGQSASSPSSSGTTQNRRASSFWRRSTVRPSESTQTAQAPSYAHSQSRPRDTQRRHQSSSDRISDILHSVISSNSDRSNRRLSTTTRVRRSRRSNTSRDRPSRTLQHLIGEESDEETSSSSRPEISLPRVDVPVPQLDLDFNSSTSPAPPQRPASQRSSIRLPNSLSDRLSGFRPNRSVTTTTTNTVLRRRRAPLQPGEDNAMLLSRLLSVAAATTAQTLLEGTHHTMAEARGVATDGEDGSFDSFLRSLESGRLAQALREGTLPSHGGSSQASLNFFRMFRFGATPARNIANSNAAGDQRMVPIIIVGIRSVVPGTAVAGSEENAVPPFLEALSGLPTTPVNANTLSRDISNGLRGSQHGSRFSHRRRASMSGVSQFPAGYDNQRHHRSPDRTRPQSVASELASWPRPPPATPATPASPNLSAANSRVPTPTPGTPAPRAPGFNSSAGRESIIRTTTTTTLETTEEDVMPPPPPRPRAGADPEHRNSTYNSRRNGIVEPDGPLPENTRSWIIYVLGGSYPENHPLLTTPSLFTDSPTYEDMMLLSTLLGPAKPPVASDTDVASAGGLYKIQLSQNEKNQTVLMAVEEHGHERIELAAEQRCLVCLCDMEKGEEARKLVECGHLFHRECIDEWLTKGRNSCPLCRGQGVKEQKKGDAPPVDSVAPTPIIPSDAHIPAVV